MKIPVLLLSIAILVACDVQSGITKKSLEKFESTPTPSVSPTPVETPIDPADIIQADTSVQGPTISVNTANDKMNVVCDKYNRLMINSNDKKVTVRGVCSQVMINGSRNQITAEAVMEVIFNGENNRVQYSRFGNGKRPAITDNKGGNITEKIAAAPSKK